MSDSNRMQCHVCGGDLVEHPEFRLLLGVTSDARPWRAGSRLASCRDCNMTIKVIDEEWRQSVKEIYETYIVYHQSNGAEKLSFDADQKIVEPRSLALVRKLLDVAPVRKTGRSLDIGTGTGVMLRALSQCRPDMKLWAQDLSAEKAQELSSIHGFQGLHVGDVTAIQDTYDVVTMVQVLEHVPDPRAFLVALKPLLGKNGVLTVNIPDAAANPFDISIVDHCSHFTLAHLQALIRSAGYDVLFASNSFLPRELVVIAQPAGAPRAPDWPSAKLPLSGYVRWLESVLAKAQSLQASGPMALFGASNAGTWVCGALEGWTGVFVDEDSNRVGNKLLGHPIVSPSAVAAGTTVFVPLADALAVKIAKRLSNQKTRYVVPDVMDAVAVQEQ